MKKLRLVDEGVAWVRDYNTGFAVRSVGDVEAGEKSDIDASVILLLRVDDQGSNVVLIGKV